MKKRYMDFLKKYEKIVVWGTGKACEHVMKCKNIKVDYYIDSKNENVEKKFLSQIF